MTTWSNQTSLRRLRLQLEGKRTQKICWFRASSFQSLLSSRSFVNCLSTSLALRIPKRPTNQCKLFLVWRFNFSGMIKSQASLTRSKTISSWTNSSQIFSHASLKKLIKSIQIWSNHIGVRSLTCSTLINSSLFQCLTSSSGRKSWNISSIQNQMKCLKNRCKNGTSKAVSSLTIILSSFKNAMRWKESLS